MNILCITYEYPPIGGGGSVVAADLNRQLASMGHRVRVVTSRMPGLPAFESRDGVEIFRTRCWRPHRHYTTAPQLLTTLIPAYRKATRLIRDERPDLIHVHFAVPSGLVAWWLSINHGIPYVLTVHGSDIPGYNPDRFIILHRLMHPIWMRIIARATAVASPSRYLATLLQRHIDVRPTVIPNGYTATPASVPVKRKLCLVVARLFPRKGVQHFIDAVAGLPTDWEFVVAGDGPHYETLKKRAEELGARISFAGFVDKATLRTMYREAAIFVFPSIQENFPVVLLEAMDAGCAVITTDAEGCAEVVGDSGLVIEKANAQQIREAILSLMHDVMLRQELSRRAETRVQLFRLPRIAAQYVELFKTALPAQPAVAGGAPSTRRPAAATGSAKSDAAKTPV